MPKLSKKSEALKATDPADLERDVMCANVPKTETEWWARERILFLEGQLAALTKERTK